jgi:hypothetical protein
MHREGCDWNMSEEIDFDALFPVDTETAVVPCVDPKSPGVERWKLVNNITMEAPDAKISYDPFSEPMVLRSAEVLDYCMQEFAEVWRAKWYQKLWYGLGCWFRNW